jgi:nucleotide-binding universal stress UspA family protein
VGTRGAGGMEKILLGSIAEEIFRSAPCPVLTVGPKLRAGMDDALIREVLLPLDFTQQAERALHHAVAWTRRHNARLTMLHVVEKATDPSPHGRDLLREVYRKPMRDLLEREDVELQPALRVEFGPATKTIIGVAAEMQASLLVLGVRKTESFATHFPWATASRIVRNAACPVLTVRA